MRRSRNTAGRAKNTVMGSWNSMGSKALGAAEEEQAALGGR